MKEYPLIYQVKELDYSYNQTSNVLSNINLTIHEKDFICFHGPSGSGKSTLLNLLGLMMPTQKGDIFFLEKKLKHLTEAEYNHIRRFQLGFIFQQFHLLPTLSAYENVEFFLARQGKSVGERRPLVEAALKQVGLWDRRSHRPAELSGGQCQRVAIARALVKQPKVIIGDEPTANLDQKNGQEIVRILHELSAERGVTVLLASHDPMVIERSTRKIQLVDGEVRSC